MNSTWYMVDGFCFINEHIIKKVEVEKATNSFVFINGKRIAINSNYNNYFQTFDEAYNFLLQKAKKRIDVCTVNLEEAKQHLQRVVEKESVEAT